MYKRSQGRIARQVTFAALAIIVALAAWSLHNFYAGRVQLATSETGAVTAESGWLGTVVVPLVVLLAGLWTSFRIVQMPNFADFLISVEAEMSKVSWPTWSELFRASLVVIVMIFVLAAILFAYDLFWRFLLEDVLRLK